MRAPRVSVDEAFRILRFGARDRRARLHDLAERVVAGTLQLDRERFAEANSSVVRLRRARPPRRRTAGREAPTT